MFTQCAVSSSVGRTPVTRLRKTFNLHFLDSIWQREELITCAGFWTTRIFYWLEGVDHLNQQNWSNLTGRLQFQAFPWTIRHSKQYLENHSRSIKSLCSRSCGVALGDSYVTIGGELGDGKNTAIKTVTEYSREGVAKQLPDLQTARYHLGCSSYKNSDGNQVRGCQRLDVIQFYDLSGVVGDWRQDWWP